MKKIYEKSAALWAALLKSFLFLLVVFSGAEPVRDMLPLGFFAAKGGVNFVRRLAFQLFALPALAVRLIDVVLGGVLFAVVRPQGEKNDARDGNGENERNKRREDVETAPRRSKESVLP